jgi:hypothetical protein
MTTAAAPTSPLRTLFHLSDVQLGELMRMAQPLQPEDRVAFLRELTARLNGCADVGDGHLHRLACEVVRRGDCPRRVGRCAGLLRAQAPFRRITH